MANDPAVVPLFVTVHVVSVIDGFVTSGLVTSGFVTSGFVTSGLVTSGLVTSGFSVTDAVCPPLSGSSGVVGAGAPFGSVATWTICTVIGPDADVTYSVREIVDLAGTVTTTNDSGSRCRNDVPAGAVSWNVLVCPLVFCTNTTKLFCPPISFLALVGDPTYRPVVMRDV